MSGAPLALLVEWGRPAGVWALLLPFVVLLFARFRARPEARATGALSVWREIAPVEAPRARGVRPRIPLAVWLCAAGLAAGALALAGPRLGAPPLPRGFVVVVDQSPSMFLPRDAGGERRLDAARERALAWLDAAGRARDRVRWIGSAGVEAELAFGTPPPPELWEAPAWEAPEPTWSRFDLPGAVFVTDRVPAVLPSRAGLAAAGGEAVPGPIGVAGADRVDWDGARLVRVPGAAPVRGARAAPDLPEVVATMLAVWAGERGLEDAADAPLALAVVPAPGPPPRVDVRVERAGWALSGSAPATGLAPPPGPPAATTWLSGRDAAGASVPLVAWRPGTVFVALAAASEPEGDPAAFALAWSELFDRAALPAPGTVPFGERQAAGPSTWREPAEAAPRPPATPGAPGAPGAPGNRTPGRAREAAASDAWLAALAGVLVVAALALSR